MCHFWFIEIWYELWSNEPNPTNNCASHTHTIILCDVIDFNAFAVVASTGTRCSRIYDASKCHKFEIFWILSTKPYTPCSIEQRQPCRSQKPSLRCIHRLRVLPPFTNIPNRTENLYIYVYFRAMINAIDFVDSKLSQAIKNILCLQQQRY